MSVYSLELTSAAGTYKFDGQSTKQADWKPHLAPEVNFDLTPVVTVAIRETWELHGFTFVASSAPGDTTTDFAALASILPNITSCVLKYGAATIRSIDTTSCSQLSVRELRTRGGDGHWTTHWRGDLVIDARRLVPTGSIVRIDQELSQAFDDAGLLVQTWSGRIEVIPGADIAAQLVPYVPALLGSAYVRETGGDAGYRLTITNRPSNTKATFRQVQREIGIALPSGATSWRQRSSVRDTADGRITTTTAQARATSVAAALRAAQSVKPRTGVAITVTEQTQDALAVAVEYTQRAPVPKVVSAYGKETLISVSWIVRVSGGGQSRSFELVPGYEPFELIDAMEPITVREHVTVRATKVTGLDDIPLPDFILNPLLLQNRGCEELPPYREPNVGETRTADVWVREATRLYMAKKSSDVDFDAMFEKLAGAPTWSGQSDASTRLGLEFTTSDDSGG